MALRSSVSDPLRIDSVRAGQSGGRVGMTFCPGKQQQFSMTGGWKRDLTLDLYSMRDWGAQVLFCLLEPHEFQSVCVSPGELSRLARGLGIESINTPIPDGSVPDDSFFAEWQRTSLRLKGIVDKGGSVVFCCLGGLGRTGTMAACLLIELGFSPAVAVAEVRVARAGAIENKTQENYVFNYRPVSR